ncbi:MAG: type II toxin-antitoxin system HicB family antitoxin, partial [Bdellovibrionales bacterium]|nr:type II toxin-antitoxin system HicB family antitoxin [Ramlibacter sp.]
MFYPAKMEPDGKGWMVSFPDIPEALTSGKSEKQALEMAKNALMTALDFYFDERTEIPEPSRMKRGQVPVELPAGVAAKVLLLNEMVRQKIRPAELARRLGTTAQEINRMTHLTHATKIDG